MALTAQRVQHLLQVLKRLKVAALGSQQSDAQVRLAVTKLLVRYKIGTG